MGEREYRLRKIEIARKRLDSKTGPGSRPLWEYNDDGFVKEVSQTLHDAWKMVDEAFRTASNPVMKMALNVNRP